MNVTEWRDALAEIVFPDRLPLQEGKRVRWISASDVRHVMGWLSTFADRGSGSNARPGVDRLVRLTGMSDKQVRRCLQVACSTRWIEVAQKGGPGRATTYALAIPSTRAGQSEENIGPPTGADDGRSNTGPRGENIGPQTGIIGPPSGAAYMSDPTCQITHDPDISNTPSFWEDASVADALAPEREEGVEIEKKPCGCLLSQTCPDCRLVPKVESRLPEHKQRQLYENNLEQNEDPKALGIFDEEEGTQVSRYRGRRSL